MNDFAQRVLTWYAQHARSLPWRGLTDPYATWISEVMLQQTRVTTVIPYFQRWMERFPTVGDLAQADRDDILALWEGLGYYRRAHYLHQAAQIIQEEFQGNLPSDPRELEKLPGIGKYTAAAIASIAFGKDVAALDGNIRRVLSRHFNLADPIYTTQGKKAFWGLAETLLPAGKAGPYNQALMDLGAQICTPTSPACSTCPVQATCRAHALGIQEERPVRKKKEPVPHHQVTAAVFLQDGAVLLAKRPRDGLLAGMWEYPGGKQEAGESLKACLEREIREELTADITVDQKMGRYEHAYTHFRVTLHSFFCTLRSEQITLTEHSTWAWVPIPNLGEYPMGKLDREISRDLQNQAENTP
jgi:A/G-specific adenine glycosylase